jgi:nitrite reductase/ring-hydroxylating ferredoxin subunit
MTTISPGSRRDDHRPQEAGTGAEPVTRSTFMRRTGMGVLLALAAGAGEMLSPLRALAAGTRASPAGAKLGRWLGNVKNVKPNQYLTYTDPKSGDPAVLIRLAGGQFVSYDAVCTHAGCTVPYDATQKLMVCPCHGARFDPARGAAVVGGPAPQPLAKLPIRVDAGGDVYALDAKPIPGKPPVNQLKPGPPASKVSGDENDDGAQGRRRKGRGDGGD